MKEDIQKILVTVAEIKTEIKRFVADVDLVNAINEHLHDCPARENTKLISIVAGVSSSIATVVTLIVIKLF